MVEDKWSEDNYNKRGSRKEGLNTDRWMDVFYVRVALDESFRGGCGFFLSSFETDFKSIWHCGEVNLFNSYAKTTKDEQRGEV